MSKLLMHYLRLAVKEAALARVPNQLISDDGHEGEEDSEEGVNEFCGVGGGGIVGYTGPLYGGSPAAGGKKRKRGK